MESSGFYDDSRMENVLIKRERISCSSQGLDSIWIPSSSSFNVATTSTSVMNIEDVQGDNDTEIRFLKHSDNKVENSNEELDGCLHPTEKKRRLSPHQVQFLEKNFEMENKLEPERKAELAKEVGLQPRQVAIWFQNRRARYKTKLLEKEYDSLKASFDKLKADYEALHKQNEKMKNEINLLTEKTSSRDNGQLKQEPYDPISSSGLLPEKAIILYPDAPAVASAKHDGGSSSARSDVFDSYSPHYNEGNHHSAYLEPTVDSSHVYEPDASDFSPQEEDDSPCRGLLILPPSYFPKLEFECNDDLQPNACNLGFPVQNQGTWFWQY